MRPKGKQTRFWTDNEYYEQGYAAVLPHSTTLVYGVLARHANAETQTCYPSAAKIMELTGIKNRQTVFDAIRMLEAFDIIAVVHSKGRTPNQYALLDVSAWKAANSDIVDTVRKTRKQKATVSRTTTQQYQDAPANSHTSDTRNHIRDSENEISSNNKEERETAQVADGDVSLLNRLTALTRSTVLAHYHEADVIAALRTLEDRDNNSIMTKEMFAVMRKMDAVPKKDLPAWLKSV